MIENPIYPGMTTKTTGSANPPTPPTVEPPEVGTLRACCPKCERSVRLRLDGKLPRHRLPNPYRLHGKFSCPASNTFPDEWRPASGTPEAPDGDT